MQLKRNREILAHHYTEAGLSAEAVPYWVRAGEGMSRRSAHIEAIRHLTKGLQLLHTLPETRERAQQELALQMAMGASMLATSGLATSETGQAYSRARELCHQLGESSQLFRALMGLRFFYTALGELQTARELGEQLLRLAQSAGDAELLKWRRIMRSQCLCIFWATSFLPASTSSKLSRCTIRGDIRIMLFATDWIRG